MSAAHTNVLLAGYEVTRDGRVFPTTNWRGLGRRELAQNLNDDGYPSVRVTLAGKRVRYSVHSLVAFAHLPPRSSSAHEVRHLDGDKMNPHADNLAWGTPKENADDRERHGRTSRGKSHAEAIKRGLPNSPWNKGVLGSIPWNKGKQTSEETRRKLSEAMRGKPWTEARRQASVR